jgi:hypothetical protein
MMGLGPYRPVRDLEYAVDRGDLPMAIAVAKDFAREYGRPIPIGLALRLLPLVVAQRQEEYDRWACRWLARWLTETLGATIDQTAEIAGALAELPTEPQSFDAIRQALGLPR